MTEKSDLKPKNQPVKHCGRGRTSLSGGRAFCTGGYYGPEEIGKTGKVILDTESPFKTCHTPEFLAEIKYIFVCKDCPTLEIYSRKRQ